MYKLEIYKVEKGKDDWKKVDIITGDTEKECLEKAEETYNIEEHHWTNPIEA